MINPEKPSGTKTQTNPSHHCPLLTKIPLEQKPILKKKKKTHRKPRRTSHFSHNLTATKPHTHKQTINRATHTQTIKPVGANNGHHTHHSSHQSANPSHRSTNPRRRFETQAIENTQKSSPEPPSEILMINPNDPPTDQQIHHFKPIDQSIQTHHQPILAQRSKPSSSIHADPTPTSKIQNPAPVWWERGRVMRDEREAVWNGWEISAMKLQRGESRWRNREGRERREQKKWEGWERNFGGNRSSKILYFFLQDCE